MHDELGAFLMFGQKIKKGRLRKCRIHQCSVAVVTAQNRNSFHCVCILCSNALRSRAWQPSLEVVAATGNLGIQKQLERQRAILGRVPWEVVATTSNPGGGTLGNQDDDRQS